MNRRFDSIVIGAGQAGPPMAGRIAATGKTVALIERKLIGGTCANTGCTPTQTRVIEAMAGQRAAGAADVKLSADGRGAPCYELTRGNRRRFAIRAAVL